MTRKDYRLIAQAILNACDNTKMLGDIDQKQHLYSISKVRDTIANALTTNLNFDQVKFYKTSTPSVPK